MKEKQDTILMKMPGQQFILSNMKSFVNLFTFYRTPLAHPQTTVQYLSLVLRII